MERILYQVFPTDTNYSYDPPPVNTNSSYRAIPGILSTDFGKVVIALVVILVSVGVFYLAYSLFLKDCILLFKAKKQRTTTEIGFGQTPARNQDHPQP
uniref:Movement protein n=1 Tax=Chickpea chlorotic dwarf virus TaxID=463360 RepID=A0A140GLP3_9GEMI|nr:movement protein [Chickpea chlorotic dwarf virus]